MLVKLVTLFDGLLDRSTGDHLCVLKLNGRDGKVLEILCIPFSHHLVAKDYHDCDLLPSYISRVLLTECGRVEPHGRENFHHARLARTGVCIEDGAWKLFLLDLVLKTGVDSIDQRELGLVRTKTRITR